MMNRVISFLSLFASIYVLYRYRYRLINMVLGQRFLRRALVALTLQIPYVRNRLMNRMVSLP
ncbi:sodium:proton antiporter [Desertibacillus haloalkaliphilus]|uniref:sodium:proton antiporter n=1 Tax=Desertibacillus haloalkaliphilus TaxID=1328930 RepID=UPI001C25EFC9|nr:sodium:proton antiporter [Desertibacillus haloalkaliphilus]MBU8905727.1 sodium:proton antiporter [Desertibacillus haloalkaliphilus]